METTSFGDCTSARVCLLFPRDQTPVMYFGQKSSISRAAFLSASHPRYTVMVCRTMAHADPVVKLSASFLHREVTSVLVGGILWEYLTLLVLTCTGDSCLLIVKWWFSKCAVSSTVKSWYYTLKKHFISSSIITFSKDSWFLVLFNVFESITVIMYCYSQIIQDLDSRTLFRLTPAWLLWACLQCIWICPYFLVQEFPSPLIISFASP